MCAESSNSQARPVNTLEPRYTEIDCVGARHCGADTAQAKAHQAHAHTEPTDPPTDPQRAISAPDDTGNCAPPQQIPQQPGDAGNRPSLPLGKQLGTGQRRVTQQAAQNISQHKHCLVPARVCEPTKHTETTHRNRTKSENRPGWR